MGQIFEFLMLVCFGLSWPFNIVKSWRSRTARGKSILFELLIFTGYILGITGKFVNGNINYVLIVYILDLLMVAIDLILTIRNMILDRVEDKKEKKAAQTAEEAKAQ